MRKPVLRLIRGRGQTLSDARWVAALQHPLVTPADVDGHREMQPLLRDWLDETVDPMQYTFMKRVTYVPGLTIIDAGSLVFHEDDAAFAFRLRWC